MWKQYFFFRIPIVKIPIHLHFGFVKNLDDYSVLKYQINCFFNAHFKSKWFLWRYHWFKIIIIFWLTYHNLNDNRFCHHFWNSGSTLLNINMWVHFNLSSPLHITLSKKKLDELDSSSNQVQLLCKTPSLDLDPKLWSFPATN